MNQFFVKTTALAIALFLTANTLSAQIKKPGVTFGGSFIYAKPKGDFATAYNYGTGGEVFGGVGYGKTFLIATLGLSGFSAYNNYPYGTLTYVPVKLGIKQFFLGKHVFINADAGFASVKNKAFNGSQFTRGIGAGVKLLGIEAALYYDGWKNKNTGGYSNSLDLKFGWSFSL